MVTDRVKRVSVVAFFFMLLIGLTSGNAQASIFMNFDTPTFTADASSGDHAHIYTVAEGNIYFNGRIWNALNGTVRPDHTTGSTNFWKNTNAQDVLTMTFDFDVDTFSLWMRRISGSFTVQGAAYNAANSLVGSGSFDALSGVWTFNNVDDLSEPIRKLVIFSSNGGGNNFAIDDLTLNPYVRNAAVPEPASVLLLSSGLIGMVRLRRKQ